MKNLIALALISLTSFANALPNSKSVCAILQGRDSAGNFRFLDDKNQETLATVKEEATSEKEKQKAEGMLDTLFHGDGEYFCLSGEEKEGILSIETLQSTYTHCGILNDESEGNWLVSESGQTLSLVFKSSESNTPFAGHILDIKVLDGVVPYQDTYCATGILGAKDEHGVDTLHVLKWYPVGAQ